MKESVRGPSVGLYSARGKKVDSLQRPLERVSTSNVRSKRQMEACPC